MEMLSLSKSKIDDLSKLRLKFWLKLLFCCMMALFAMLLLLTLDHIFKLSEKLSFHLHKWISGHEIGFPSMSDSSFLSIASLGILAIFTAIFCKCYIEHQQAKEALESKTTKKKSIPKRAFLAFALFMPLNDIVGWFLDELNSSIGCSLSDVTAKELYLWLSYLAVILILIVSQGAEIKKIKLLNALEGHKDESKMVSVRTAIALLTLATSIIGTSFGLSRLDVLNFKLECTILGQKIEFVNNESNVAVMLLCQVMLFAIVYGIMKVQSRNDLKMFFKELPKAMALSIGGGITGVLSISAINTLKNIELSSVAIIIPLLILVLANVCFSWMMIVQFRNKEATTCVSEKIQLPEKHFVKKLSYTNGIRDFFTRRFMLNKNPTLGAEMKELAQAS